MSFGDFIRSILTSFVIISLTLLFSCASSETTDGDPLAELGGAVAQGEGDAFGGDLGAIPDEDIPLEEALGGDLGEGGFGGDDLGNLEGLEGLEGDLLAPPPPSGGDGGGKLDEFGLPMEEEMALDAGGLPAPESLPADQNLDATFGAEPNSDPNDLDLDNVLGLPSDSELAKAQEYEAAQAALDAKGGDVPFGDLGFDQGGYGAAPAKPWSGSSQIPTIPAEAFEQEGALLNRFYFVRQGDTADSLSQLLLGDGSRGQAIKAWNRGRLRPGKLIYYPSPLDSSDRQMRSFYQERNVPPQQITVQRGQTLSVIAKQELGSFQSYKEIAVVNGMATADGLTPGQPLAIYPRDLSPYGPNGGGGGYGQVTPPPGIEESPAIAASPPPPIQNDPPIQFSPPPPVQQQVKQRRLPPRRDSRPKSGLSIGKIIQQNGFFILVGTGLIVLISALILVKRRNRTRQEDYSDDDLFGDQMK